VVTDRRTHAEENQPRQNRFCHRKCRTWVSGPQCEVSGPGSQDLGFRPSVFGSQDLGFRTSKALHPTVVLSFSRHFSLRPVVTDRRMADDEEEEESERRTGLCILIHRQNRFCHRKCRPVLPVQAGSAGELKRGTVVSLTDARTHYVNLYIRYIRLLQMFCPQSALCPHFFSPWYFYTRFGSMSYMFWACCGC
jgi:hypothetical protein